MNKDHIHKRRLLQLVQLLRELPPKRFDYTHWVGTNWGGKTDLSCGTTACAFGWATTMPSLKRLGLHLERDPHDRAIVDVVFGEGPSKLEGSEAGHAVFGLSEDEYNYIFTPGNETDDFIYPEMTDDFLVRGFNKNKPGEKATAKQVAKHIENFVKVKYKEARTR